MDTTKLGAISGTAGALASVIPGFLEKNVLKVAKVTFLDYAAVLTVGHQVTDIWHWLIAVAGHITFGAVLGVAFAFFIKNTDNESLIWKGAGYGALLWLSTLALGSFFKLPHFKVTDPSDCFFIMIDAVIYGLTLAFFYRLLTRRQKTWGK